MNIIQKLAVTAALTASVASSLAASIQWSGAASQNWSNGNNWTFGFPPSPYGSAPQPSDFLFMEDIFNPGGPTNVVGAVNNIVDSSFTVGSLNYTANSNSNHVYTTLIPSGVTLTVGGFGPSTPALCVGDVAGSGAWTTTSGWTNYTTITGPGTLNVSDPNGLISISMKNAVTLDLTGLNTFTADVSNIWVCASSDNPGTGLSGNLLLAKTNILTTSPNTNAPSIMLGYFNNGQPNGTLLLGQTNQFNTDGLVVGGARNGSSAGSAMFFASAYSNSAAPGTFTLRGSAGDPSRAAVFSVGDQAARQADYFSPAVPGTTGKADFSGGSVDILADQIYVGRTAGDAAGNGGSFVQVAGTLTVEHGIVDANNLYISYKQGSNIVSATPCAVTIRSNAQMTVHQDITLAFRNNSTNGSLTPFGQLTVSDSAVVNVGGNITAPTNAISSLQFGGGTLNMTGSGNVTVTTLTGPGSITGASTITIYSNLAPGGSKTVFLAGLSASNGTPASGIGTLNLTGNLFYTNSQPITFDLGPTNTVGQGVNDYLNVTGDINFNNNPLSLTFNGPLIAGKNYTLVNFTGNRNGTLTFVNPTRSNVTLDQGTPGAIILKAATWTPATLSFVGTNITTVWNTATLCWTNAALGTNDIFYQGDAVVFDEGVFKTFTNVVPGGILYPASITINNTNQTVNMNSTAQAGGIAGACSIDKNGPGTLVFGLPNNTFTGPFNINNGIVKLSEGSFNNSPGLGSTNGTLFVNNGATFDFNGQSSTSPGKTVVIAGNGFNGTGVLTNNGSQSQLGFLVTLAGDSLISPGANNNLGICSASGITTQLSPPFSGALHLNGNTLTILGNAAAQKGFFLHDVVANDNGNINVGSGFLAVINTILGGTSASTVTFSNGTSLAFGVSASAGFYSFSSNSISKPLAFYNAAIESPYRGATAPILPTATPPIVAPAFIGSTVSLLGTQNLAVTNFNTVLMNGIISGNSGIGITKYGTGILTLNNADTYSGPTLVTAGTLALGSSGSIAASPAVTINPGATLDTTANPNGMVLASGQLLNMGGTTVGNLTAGIGSTLIGSGSINGTLTIQSNAVVAPAGTNNTGHFIVSGNLVLNGGQFNMEAEPTFAASDAFEVTSNLTLTGTNTFTISSIGGFSPNNTNTLITYGGTSNASTNNIQVLTEANSRFVVQLVDPATTQGKIQFKLVTPSPLLTWAGGAAANPNAWDIRTTTNWLNGVTNDFFYSADLVRFDDTATTNVVNLTTSVGPNWMSMENSTKPYVFNGPGRIITATLTNYTGSVTFSNLGNNIISGSGLTINGGNVTFAQPTNAILTADLLGSGTLTKAGPSNLTLVVENSSTGFNGTVAVAGGTLTAGSSNCLGSGTVNIASGSSLDVNGQILQAPSIVNVAGVGADTLGAVNNRGLLQSNALNVVSLTADATFGAISNRWDLRGSLAGNGHTLTKMQANDIWLVTGNDTGLGDINIGGGRLVFGADPNVYAPTLLGDGTKTVTVSNSASLALAGFRLPSGSVNGGGDTGTKTIKLLNGGILDAINGTNFVRGQLSLSTNNSIRCSGQLFLNGPIVGNANVTFTNSGTGAGQIVLSGTNYCTTNGTSFQRLTNFVTGGQLWLSNNLALPSNSAVVVDFGANLMMFNGFVFSTNMFSTNPSVFLRFTSFQAMFGGDGTCNVPLTLLGTGTPGSSAWYIYGGTNGGITINGPIITTGASGSIELATMTMALNSALNVTTNTVIIGAPSTGVPATYDRPFLTLNQQNTWGATRFNRGVIILGTNNALPPTAPITWGNLQTDDQFWQLDMQGFNQTFPSITDAGVPENPLIIGNSSTVNNSTLTYAGTLTGTNFNITATTLVDVFPGSSGTKNVGLTVNSGNLMLEQTNTYSGPTIVNGGRLLVNTLVLNNLGHILHGQIVNSPITVNGGVFGGNGSVGGSVIVASGGTLSPGSVAGGIASSPIGTFTINNTLTFQTGSTSLMDVDNTVGTNDNVAVLSQVSYAGTLMINNLSTTPYTNNQVLKLFSAGSYIGAFDNIIIPGALTYDASNLTVDGTIKIVSVASDTPAPITFTKTATQLQLSWPADHTGWRLQSQTNALSVGLKTTNLWFDVPGSALTNQITVPLVKTNPTVFYRLIYP
jgi:autotransporter-associated beta strand protein